MEKLDIKKQEDGICFRVLVSPRASKSAITGVTEGVLKARLAAPPVDGAANGELVTLLAKTVGVTKSSVKIKSGKTSRRKSVCIKGVEPEDIKAALDI